MNSGINERGSAREVSKERNRNKRQEAESQTVTWNRKK